VLDSIADEDGDLVVPIGIELMLETTTGVVLDRAAELRLWLDDIDAGVLWTCADVELKG
jgi:hypothetical protein